jgi:hypothetical protein
LAKAPAWLKQAFQHWVESWGWASGEHTIYPYSEIVFDVGRERENWPVPRVLGKLWHCTDKMPGHLCERVNLPSGSTYAKAAQLIMAAGRRGKFHIPRSGYRVPPE